MKIKVLKRNPEDYVRESKHDIHKINRKTGNPGSHIHLLHMYNIISSVLWNTRSRRSENTSVH